ncbi:unnamed protein product [Lactuca saligna]|uniref:Uncharacterized protein n=1 Tax=Lactuca saligna TaxID=75948 RepID=A0AA35Y8C9_LACSI|nr:unnamed protein product [Lactuca saligna]
MVAIGFSKPPYIFSTSFNGYHSKCKVPTPPQALPKENSNESVESNKKLIDSISKGLIRLAAAVSVCLDSPALVESLTIAFPTSHTHEGGLVKAGLDVAQICLDGDETLVNTIDRDGNMLLVNMINGHALTLRQRPHQKKYKLRTGCVNVSHFHKPGNRVHTKATTQETCNTWRKRGNEVYKSGDLSEAEQSCNYTHGSWKNEGKCLNDCRMAATLDPNFMKLGKHKEVVQLCEQTLDTSGRGTSVVKIMLGLPP